MLIHIGNDDFLHLDDVVGIFHNQTLTKEMQEKVSQAVGPLKPDIVRSVILTRKNRWFASIISSEALYGKRLTDLFQGALYTRKTEKKTSIANKSANKSHKVQELKS